MNATDSNSTLTSDLETLASYVNDSIKGFEKAIQSIHNSAGGTKQLLATMKDSRERQASLLKDRLETLGQESDSSGSFKGASHRALISIQDLFTSSKSTDAIIHEAIRGEKKLLEHINDTYADLEAIDSDSHRTVQHLRQDVERSIADLQATQ